MEATAPQIGGCVTGSPAQREGQLGNTYRIPFDVVVPAETGLGLNRSDNDLDLVDALGRVAARASGMGYLPPRGHTGVGMPAATEADGRYGVRVQPDQLGFAINAILGVLSFIPGRAEFTQTLDRQVLVTIFDSAESGQTVTQIFETARVTITRSLEKGKGLEAAETFFEIGGCVLKSIEAGVGAVLDRDPAKFGEATFDVVKECLGQVLEKSESAFKTAWTVIKGVLDGAQVLRQIADATNLAGTQLGAQVAVSINRIDPVLLSQDQDRPTKGLGVARPSEINFGGDGNGVVTDIVWDSWGGPTATGHGQADWVPPGEVLAGGVEEPAQLLVSDLGSCGGVRAYRSLKWYFPQHGESPATTPAVFQC